MAVDLTRTASLAAKRGVRSMTCRSFGPISFSYVETDYAIQRQITINLPFLHSVSFAFGRAIINGG